MAGACSFKSELPKPRPRGIYGPFHLLIRPAKPLNLIITFNRIVFNRNLKNLLKLNALFVPFWLSNKIEKKICPQHTKFSQHCFKSYKPVDTLNFYNDQTDISSMSVSSRKCVFEIRGGGGKSKTARR